MVQGHDWELERMMAWSKKSYSVVVDCFGRLQSRYDVPVSWVLECQFDGSCAVFLDQDE